MIATPAPVVSALPARRSVDGVRPDRHYRQLAACAQHPHRHGVTRPPGSAVDNTAQTYYPLGTAKASGSGMAVGSMFADATNDPGTEFKPSADAAGCAMW